MVTLDGYAVEMRFSAFPAKNTVVYGDALVEGYDFATLGADAGILVILHHLRLHGLFGEALEVLGHGFGM